MKKLLALLGVVSLGITGTSAVVACGPVGEAVKNYNLNSDTIKILQGLIEKQDDIHGYVEKGLTYDEFFNIVTSQENKANFLEDFVYSAVRNELTALKNENGEAKYTTEQIKKQVKNVLKWTQDAVNLVYLDENKDSHDQEIITTFTRASAGNGTLENIFRNEVKKYTGCSDEDFKDPEFWKDHAYSSLGISFNKKQGNVDLGEKARDFWAFSFKA